MGCAESSPGFELLMKSPEFRHTMAQLNSMQLSENDVKRLYRVFEVVDQDHSNSIALVELMDHIDLPRTVYTEKIFSIFDKDKSGSIDFREFVFSVWNYCTLTKINLDQFAFDLYDTDGSGSLSPAEVLKMIQDIFGKNEMKTNVHAKAISTELQQFEDKKQNFDAEKFHKFMLYHQAMLFPAFQMQLALQRKILGIRFWERQSERRLHDSNGEYVSISRYAMKTQQELSSNNDAEPRHRNKRKNGSATSSLSSQPSTLSSNSRGSNLRGSFSASAAETWNAGVQGVANLFVSGKHKKDKTSKVHPCGVLPPTDTSFAPPSLSKHHSPSNHHSHSHSTHSGQSSHSGHSPHHRSHHHHHHHHGNGTGEVMIEIKGVGSPVVSPRHSHAHGLDLHGHQNHHSQSPHKHDHDESSTHSGLSSHSHSHAHSPSHCHSHSSSHHALPHSPHHGHHSGHHNDQVVKHYTLVEPFTEIDEVDPVSGTARSRANTAHVSATNAAAIAEHLKKRHHTGI